METASWRVVQGTAILCRHRHATAEGAGVAKPLRAHKGFCVSSSHLGFALGCPYLNNAFYCAKKGSEFGLRSDKLSCCVPPLLLFVPGLLKP